jgi:hypothetical protein
MDFMVESAFVHPETVISSRISQIDIISFSGGYGCSPIRVIPSIGQRTGQN